MLIVSDIKEILLSRCKLPQMNRLNNLNIPITPNSWHRWTLSNFRKIYCDAKRIIVLALSRLLVSKNFETQSLYLDKSFVCTIQEVNL
eukprot:snap_masked-scaffold_28-processed-gene-1.28-mRNA-1 protein AED:1.00 eAED:1.00 QI:0/0/0/0/1/1/2/0/87